jgi:hypothetical protein
MPPLRPALEARIDAIWANAAARVEAGGAGRMFNGQIFSMDTISPALIAGHLTEYRRLVAQMEDRALFADLGIRSLAVCGVLRCRDGILVGRRPAAAIYQPGQWQLCPAGSIDASAWRPEGVGLDGGPNTSGTMDYRAQLLTEIREELGLEPEAIGPASPLCVVEHPGSHVSDLGLMVSTRLDANVVLEAHRMRGNGEYDPLRIVPITELRRFIDWAGDSLVPPAALFLAHAGLLPEVGGAESITAAKSITVDYR